MSTVKILIECSGKEHAAIEEHCINEGINLSAYFLGLHKLSTQEQFVVPAVALTGEIPKKTKRDKK